MAIRVSRSSVRRRRVRVLAAALESDGEVIVGEIARRAEVSDDYARAVLVAAGARRQPRRLKPRAVRFWDEIEALERRLIARALEACRGNASAAARHLGLNLIALARKVAKFGLGARTQRRTGPRVGRIDVRPLPRPFWAQLDDLRRALLTEALTRFQGNSSWAAAWLRLDRVTLIRMAAALGVQDHQSHRPGRARCLFQVEPARLAAALDPHRTVARR